MKGFALVLWTETNESSVIKENDTRIGKNLITKGKWGEKWYPIEIIKRHHDKDYLETLSVTVNGQILTPEKRNSVSPDLLLAKRTTKEKNRLENASKKNTLRKENSVLLNTNSIFSPKLLNKESIKEDYDEITSDDSYKSKCSNALKNGEHTSINVVRNLEKALPPSTCFCQKLQPMTEEDVDKLNIIINLMKTIKLPQISSASVTSKPSEINGINKSNEMELIPNTNVFVNRSKTNFLTIQWNKKPRELVRRLMKLIVGENILKESSATGKKWRPIPDNVYTAVFEYVNKNAPKKKYTLEAAEYREVLTALCATLRNPKKYDKSEKRVHSMPKKVTNSNEKKINDNDKNNYAEEKRMDVDDKNMESEGKKENEFRNILSETGESSTTKKTDGIKRKKMSKVEEVKKKLEDEYLEKLRTLEEHYAIESEDEINNSEKKKKLNLID